MSENSIKILTTKDLGQILKLTKQLNPDLAIVELEDRQMKMFKYENYKCFGLLEGDKLIGLSSGWVTVRLYSGKQLEIDNVIIDNTIQSKGYGKKLMSEIETWAKLNNCQSIELNTYVQNGRSHKFYFSQGYNILGFHFQKFIHNFK